MSTVTFALSINVSDTASPHGPSFKISIQTTVDEWNVVRTIGEIEIFHTSISKNIKLRGINLPRIPSKPATSSTIKKYFSTLLHRSILLGNEDILNFIKAPDKTRNAAIKLLHTECVPVRTGIMNKEGEKWKGYKSRYFALCPNYLLSYFENIDAFQIGVDPKGSIDLTLATKILVYDKASNPYSMGIKCPNRIWKLQCNEESERDGWVKSLRDLLQNPKYNGYISNLEQMKNQNTESNAIKVEDKELEMDESSDDNDENEQKIDTQIGALRQRLDTLTDKKDTDREELQKEVAMEFEGQFAMQKVQMIKFKREISKLTEQTIEIEQKRKEDQERNLDKINALKEELNGLKTINDALSEQVEEKEQGILQTQNDLKEINATINALQAEENKFKWRDYAIHGTLMKVQGDALSKLKYKKVIKKEVVFVEGMNGIFYFDDKEQKYMNVKEVSTNNSTIQKQLHLPWFILKGEDRLIALFCVNDKSTRDEWVNFIKKALAKTK